MEERTKINRRAIVIGNGSPSETLLKKKSEIIVALENIKKRRAAGTDNDFWGSVYNEYKSKISNQSIKTSFVISVLHEPLDSKVASYDLTEYLNSQSINTTRHDLSRIKIKDTLSPSGLRFICRKTRKNSKKKPLPKIFHVISIILTILLTVIMPAIGYLADLSSFFPNLSSSMLLTIGLVILGIILLSELCAFLAEQKTTDEIIEEFSKFSFEEKENIVTCFKQKHFAFAPESNLIFTGYNSHNLQIYPEIQLIIKKYISLSKAKRMITVFGEYSGEESIFSLAALGEASYQTLYYMYSLSKKEKRELAEKYNPKKAANTQIYKYGVDYIFNNLETENVYNTAEIKERFDAQVEKFCQRTGKAKLDMGSLLYFIIYLEKNYNIYTNGDILSLLRVFFENAPQNDFSDFLAERESLLMNVCFGESITFDLHKLKSEIHLIEIENKKLNEDVKTIKSIFSDSIEIMAKVDLSHWREICQVPSCFDELMLVKLLRRQGYSKVERVCDMCYDLLVDMDYDTDEDINSCKQRQIIYNLNLLDMADSKQIYYYHPVLIEDTLSLIEESEDRNVYTELLNSLFLLDAVKKCIYLQPKELKDPIEFYLRYRRLNSTEEYNSGYTNAVPESLGIIDVPDSIRGELYFYLIKNGDLDIIEYFEYLYDVFVSLIYANGLTSFKVFNQKKYIGIDNDDKSNHLLKAASELCEFLLKKTISKKDSSVYKIIHSLNSIMKSYAEKKSSVSRDNIEYTLIISGIQSEFAGTCLTDFLHRIAYICTRNKKNNDSKSIYDNIPVETSKTLELLYSCLSNYSTHDCYSKDNVHFINLLLCSNFSDKITAGILCEEIIHDIPSIEKGKISPKIRSNIYLICNIIKSHIEKIESNSMLLELSTLLVDWDLLRVNGKLSVEESKILPQELVSDSQISINPDVRILLEEYIDVFIDHNKNRVIDIDYILNKCNLYSNNYVITLLWWYVQNNTDSRFLIYDSLYKFENIIRSSHCYSYVFDLLCDYFRELHSKDGKTSPELKEYWLENMERCFSSSCNLAIFSLVNAYDKNGWLSIDEYIKYREIINARKANLEAINAYVAASETNVFSASGICFHAMQLYNYIIVCMFGRSIHPNKEFIIPNNNDEAVDFICEYFHKIKPIYIVHNRTAVPYTVNLQYGRMLDIIYRNMNGIQKQLQDKYPNLRNKFIEDVIIQLEIFKELTDNEESKQNISAAIQAVRKTR